MFKKYHPVPHSMTMYSGKILNFLQTDSEELFQKVKKEHPEQIYQLRYKFNRFGFRCNEFTETNNAVFLGCSYTFGLATREEYRWTSVLSKIINLEEFNLAVPGSSSDTAFRLAHNWIPQLKPKMVFFLSTHHPRVEIFNDKGPHTFLPSQEQDIPDELKSFYRTWISYDSNFYYNHLKNLLGIEAICKKNNVKLFHIPISEIQRIDLARDLGHFGDKTHANVAHKFLSLI